MSVLQLDIRLVERDWRWHCERFYSLPLARSMFTTTQVEIFFIDTNPALPEYHEARWAERPGVSQHRVLRHADLSEQYNEVFEHFLSGQLLPQKVFYRTEQPANHRGFVWKPASLSVQMTVHNPGRF